MINKPHIITKWQKRNKYGRPGTPLTAKKIAIHYTGSPDVPGYKTVSYFNNVVANGHKVNGKFVYASAHYVIDLDGTIYQLIPTTERCYATNSANAYAIAIEVATTGKDNHYTDATYKSMVWLCAWLCQYRNLSCKTDIITHTDVVGKKYKLCPIYMVKNPDKMQQFKTDCHNLLIGKINLWDIVNCTAPDYNPTNTNVIENLNGEYNSRKTNYSHKIPKMIKVIKDVNYRNEPNFKSSSIVGVAKAGEIFTVAELIPRSDTNMYKLKSDYYITANSKYVEEFAGK